MSSIHSFIGLFHECQFTSTYGTEITNLRVGKTFDVIDDSAAGSNSETVAFLQLGGKDLPGDSNIIVKIGGDDDEYMVMLTGPYALGKKFSKPVNPKAPGTVLIIAKGVMVVRAKRLTLVNNVPEHPGEYYVITEGQTSRFGDLVTTDSLQPIPGSVTNDVLKNRSNFLNVHTYTYMYNQQMRIMFTIDTDVYDL